MEQQYLVCSCKLKLKERRGEERRELSEAGIQLVPKTNKACKYLAVCCLPNAANLDVVQPLIPGTLAPSPQCPALDWAVAQFALALAAAALADHPSISFPRLARPLPPAHPPIHQLQSHFTLCFHRISSLCIVSIYSITQFPSIAARRVVSTTAFHSWQLPGLHQLHLWISMRIAHPRSLLGVRLHLHLHLLLQLRHPSHTASTKHPFTLSSSVSHTSTSTSDPSPSSPSSPPAHK